MCASLMSSVQKSGVSQSPLVSRHLRRTVTDVKPVPRGLSRLVRNVPSSMIRSGRPAAPGSEIEGQIAWDRVARFALEPAHAPGLSGQFRGKEFERNLAAKPSLCCEPDLSHSALPYGGVDFIWTDPSPRRQRHQTAKHFITKHARARLPLRHETLDASSVRRWASIVHLPSNRAAQGA